MHDFHIKNGICNKVQAHQKNSTTSSAPDGGVD
jgi:hypothetical protein